MLNSTPKTDWDNLRALSRRPGCELQTVRKRGQSAIKWQGLALVMRWDLVEKSEEYEARFPARDWRRTHCSYLFSGARRQGGRTEGTAVCQIRQEQERGH